MRSKPSTSGLLLAAGLSVFAVTTLTACGGDKGDSRQFSQLVTANKNNITRIELAANEGVVHAKGTHQFQLLGFNADGTQFDITDKTTWTVSDQNLATITKGGLLTPKVDNGDLTLTASFAGLTATQPVSISDADLVSITVENANTAVNVCQDTRFTGKALLANGLTLDYPLQWRLANSEDSTKAAFSDVNQPVLHTYQSGAVNVIAEGRNNAGQLIASAPFTMNISDSLVSLSLASSRGNTSNGVVLSEGQTTELSATANWTDGSSGNITRNARLSVDNTEWATINAQTNVLTANTGSYEGNVVNVTALCDDQTASLAIEINKADINKVEITGSGNGTGGLTVNEGSSLTLRLTATFEDNGGSEQNFTHNVEWSIDSSQSGAFNPNLIRITDAGVLETSSDLNLNGRLNLLIRARVLDDLGNPLRNRAGVALEDTETVVVVPRIQGI